MHTLKTAALVPPRTSDAFPTPIDQSVGVFFSIPKWTRFGRWTEHGELLNNRGAVIYRPLPLVPVKR